MSTHVLLKMSDLTKRFRDFTALEALNLEVYAGEVFGFLGPNGAGKTTTISLILGYLYPTRGEIQVCGQEVTPRHVAPLRKVGAQVGSPGMLPHLSARQNLALLRHLHPETPLARIDTVLEQVGLTQAADRAVRTYSLGMTQRLGLAAALLHRPSLLILDEPTNGLDPAGMREMRALLRRLPEEGVTVFLSSHLLHEVEQICDRVAVLNQGHLVAQGRVMELLSSSNQRARFRVASPEAALSALASLTELSASLEPDGWLQIEGLPSEIVNRHLVEAGHSPSEIQINRPDLEALFFELTQESAGIDGAARKGL